MPTLQAMAVRNDTTTIERELDWQGRVDGDAAKCTSFKDQCLSQSTFRAFAFMKGKSPVVHMAHSIGQFFGMSGLALDVQGKQIGFIRDRMNGRCPVPFILPPVNTWSWQKTQYVNDTARFTTHYESMENADKRWSPRVGEGEQGVIEAPLPRLLALPKFVAQFLCGQGGTCLPHKLRTHICDRIDSGEFNVPAEKWQLLLNWCLAASQEREGTSLLNIGLPEPALCQDQEFLEWCEHRLLSTLGPANTTPVGAHARCGGEGDLQMVERITNNMERSFLAGVHALAPTLAGAARQAGIGHKESGGDDVGGKLYTKNNMAALKGYCGVDTPGGIPTIWDSFQQTREIALHRHNLRVAMTQWSKTTGKDINKAPFFTEQTIKDIVGLTFNPGEAVPTFSSAQRGISILTCRPKSVIEVETIKDFEEARRATAHTAQFNEVRR
jgi:hypothetical protein